MLNSTISSTAGWRRRSRADSGDGGDGASDTIAVTLITKDSVNPFFVAMQEGAKKAGDENGVDITIASGAEDGDEQGQIEAIDAAIAAGRTGS